MKRRIINGIPAALTVWVSSSEAYAEVQFDDDDPTMNEALHNALSANRDTIESDSAPLSTGADSKREGS